MVRISQADESETHQKEANLISSERGAIMVIGLLMALALIGTLWFLLGMGATIAFRDRMQDAADAAAFSQAACNARAMNAICVLNLIILVLVAIYLIASIAVTVLFVTCSILTVDVLTWPKVPGCWRSYSGSALGPIGSLSGGVVDARNRMARGLNHIEGLMHDLAEGIAVVAPYVGVAAGIDVAHDYKATGPDGKLVIGLAFSETLILGDGAGQNNGERIGLPVENEPLSNDCKHLTSIVKAEVMAALSGKSSKGGFVDKVEGLIAQGVDYYYCKDGGILGLARWRLGGGDDGSYWSKPGPLRQWKHSESGGGSHTNEEKNGADIYQSWSIAVQPQNYDDNDAEHKIHLASQVYGGQNGRPRALFYYSEAEFYFDCADKWSTPACNDEPDDSRDMDMTLYSLNWRARLVRMHSPSELSGIFAVIGDVLGIFTSIRSFENDHADVDQWIQALTGLGIFDQFAGILRAVPASNHH